MILRRVAGPSPPRSAWATQKRSGGGEPLATASDLTGPGIEPKTSHADSDVFNQGKIFYRRANTAYDKKCIFIVEKIREYEKKVSFSTKTVEKMY